MENNHIKKSHNKSLLLYHIVCSAKYRRKVFTESVEKTLKEICHSISLRYEINFVEIGSDEDHVHFLELRLWEIHYNRNRPHQGIHMLTPFQRARQQHFCRVSNLALC